jgi:hypothetical protein
MSFFGAPARKDAENRKDIRKTDFFIIDFLKNVKIGYT